MATLFNTFCRIQTLRACTKQSFNIISAPSRNISTTLTCLKRFPNIPKYRHFEWLPRPTHSITDQQLTEESQQFIDEVVKDKYGSLDNQSNSPLKTAPIEPITEWQKGSKRPGLIGKKIGSYPMWLKNGKKVYATLLQIIDNQVVKYIPAEEHNPMIRRVQRIKSKLGCIIIGAENMNPQLCTREYLDIFLKSGITPKRILHRFFITPNAALQPGTPLSAGHFRPDDVVDIRAKTIYRGFQGVMKRWGFKGQPASHGQTKTHRRPGNIGSGGTKARVMPGQKMPGHMGNKWRVMRGMRILRVNMKYNVIWILGPNLPGEINTSCFIYDTLLPLRQPKTPPYFPTYLPGINAEPLPEEMYAEDVHKFNDPTITFTENS